MLFQSLSSFARAKLNLSDGKIQDRDKAELRVIENWERAHSNEVGAVESARLALHKAVLEMSDSAADYRLLKATAALPGSGPVARERAVNARKALLSTLEWIDHCALEYRNALRKEAESGR